MNNNSFFLLGTSSTYPDYENDRIVATNKLALIGFVTTLPFLYIIVYFAPGVTIWLILQLFFNLSGPLLNYLRYHASAKFAVGSFNAAAMAIMHAYLLNEKDTINAGLYGLQMSYCLTILALYDSRDKRNLYASIAFNVVCLLSVPFLKDYLIYEYDSKIIFTGWVSAFLYAASIVSLMSNLFFLVDFADKSTLKNNLFIEEVEKKNAVLRENESKLNEYIKEVQKSNEEEKHRKWISDGLAKISEILYSSNSIDVIYDKIVSETVKYTGTNQGGLFIKEEVGNNEIHLELKSCYAYDRKKFIKKTIIPGEGLVGECFLEKEPIYLTNVPDNYANITSGLGQATPKVIYIQPLKFNDNIEGVLEIASFFKLEEYKKEFIAKLCETIASVINTMKINEKTKILLEQSQLVSEQMKAQEEEMRQNLEELMATQEEMARKENELRAQSELLELVIDNIPFPVFIKDENGKYTLVNKAETEIFNVGKDEIIGYDDTKFVIDPLEIERIKRSDYEIVKRNKAVHFPEQTLTLENGVIKVFKTSKIPFFNKITGKVNIIGVSVDLSDVKRVEAELTEEINKLKKIIETYQKK